LVHRWSLGGFGLGGGRRWWFGLFSFLFVLFLLLLRFLLLLPLLVLFFLLLLVLLFLFLLFNIFCCLLRDGDPLELVLVKMVSVTDIN
jgi:hypothetical protein